MRALALAAALAALAHEPLLPQSVRTSPAVFPITCQYLMKSRPRLWTVSTGQGACLTTCSATLPSRSRSMPPATLMLALGVTYWLMRERDDRMLNTSAGD